MKPELSRPLAVERVGRAGVDLLVEASRDECDALARRMNLPAMLSLTCRFHLEPDLGETLLARGHLAAHVVQTCVVSLDDFTTIVEERFALRIVRAGTEADNPDPEALDEIPFADGIVDLGEATAEQLALALDPYPRAPGAVLPVDPDAETHPFAALTALQRRH
jgi:uncharacterized metal-binding protein YceD (DUF177 family)